MPQGPIPGKTGRSPRVLVVDDEAPIRALCRKILLRDGCEVEEAADGSAALSLLELGDFDVVVTDLRRPEVEGLDVLRAVKAKQPDVEVVVITAHGTIQDAIEAMREGALDFLVKPFDLQEFSLVIAKALERRSMVREIRTLRKELQTRYQLGNLRGKGLTSRTRCSGVLTGPSSTPTIFLTRCGEARNSSVQW